MVDSKRCFKCELVKPLSDFYKHPQMADGHVNKCKECNKRDASEHRTKNIERIRKYDLVRAKLPHRTKAALEQARKWRNEDKRRTHCHNKVTRALRSGALLHKPCEWPGCGSEKSMAHHESYDKPLDVIFYCQHHHKWRHIQMKEEGIIP